MERAVACELLFKGMCEVALPKLAGRGLSLIKHTKECNMRRADSTTIVTVTAQGIGRSVADRFCGHNKPVQGHPVSDGPIIVANASILVYARNAVSGTR
jgi:hypothetical protein